MNFRNTLVAATILAMPLAANAQPIDGLYIGAGAGVNIMQDEGAKVGVAGGGGAGGWLKTTVGPAFDVSLGYGLGNGLRAEIEGNFTYNTFHGGGYGGNEQKYGAMANVLYDFVGVVPMVQPYVGAGVGYEWANDKNLHAVFPGGAVVAPADTQGRLAYQGIIGAALPITGAPGLSLTLDYRFLGLVGNHGFAATAVPTVGAARPAHIELDSDYNHTVMIGFTYAFGAAPAAPPAPPPAAAVPPSPVSRSYLVFFDWDKAVLTDRARQIVSEAATNSKKVQLTKIEVNGYTDTSGTPQYNQGLSVRRAQAVAAELVKDGVPSSAIAIQGFGETHLLVATGPGVREPQNRRVEIIIR